MQIKNLTMSFDTQILFENINLNIPWQLYWKLSRWDVMAKSLAYTKHMCKYQVKTSLYLRACRYCNFYFKLISNSYSIYFSSWIDKYIVQAISLLETLKFVSYVWYPVYGSLLDTLVISTW